MKHIKRLFEIQIYLFSIINIEYNHYNGYSFQLLTIETNYTNKRSLFDIGFSSDFLYVEIFYICIIDTIMYNIKRKIK